MSVFEVRGGNDRRSMIKRYERKSKHDAIRELVDLVHCTWQQIEQQEARLDAQKLSATIVAEAQHWEKSLRDVWPVDADDAEGAWAVGAIDDGENYPVITVDADQYDAPGDSEKIARALTALWSQAFSTRPTRTSPPPAAAIPEGFALVPILPTPEMVSAAEEAHIPFGDMELAVRLAILSAPGQSDHARRVPHG